MNFIIILLSDIRKEGGILMKLREGIIPTGLGVVATTAGATLASLEILPVVAAGVVGFGLAHIVLGTIDVVQHRKKK